MCPTVTEEKSQSDSTACTLQIQQDRVDQDIARDNGAQNEALAQQPIPADGGLVAWRVLLAAFVFEALLWGKHPTPNYLTAVVADTSPQDSPSHSASFKTTTHSSPNSREINRTSPSSALWRQAASTWVRRSWCPWRSGGRVIGGGWLQWGVCLPLLSLPVFLNLR